MYDYQWLTDLMTTFGQEYPTYFDRTLGADLRTCVLIFWAVILCGVCNHPYWKERKKE